MGFSQDYFRLKEHYKSDKEIARILCMSYSSFYQMKRRLGLPTIRRPRKNYQGLTEEQLQYGESIGLSRRVMCKRVRAYGWKPKEACSLKIGGKRRIGVGCSEEGRS